MMTHQQYLDALWQIAILRFRDADTAELQRRVEDYEAEKAEWDLPEDFAGFVEE